MNPRGQIFRDGSAETPREMARREMREELSTALSDLRMADLCAANCPICKAEELAELNTPQGAVIALPECPNCGQTGGDPVRLGTGETSAATGYCDEGDGCTLCDPRRERAQPFEVQEDGDVTF